MIVINVKTCNGKRRSHINKNIEIKINPGVEDEEKIIFENQGHYKNEKSIADLVIIVKIKEHDIFKRVNKKDLITNHTINLIDILTCSTQKITFLNNKDIFFNSSSLVNPESTYKIINQGLPTSNGQIGDLYIKIIVKYPTNLNTINNYKNILKNILNQNIISYDVPEENIKLLLENVENIDEKYTSDDDDADNNTQDEGGVQCQQQ